MPEEIASIIHFLASDEAAYITGHVLYVDGGWLLHRNPAGEQMQRATTAALS